MRIIGGQFKGRKLVEFDGQAIRPTGDRVKESLFNILAYRFYGARVLDLFSGSGALGIESLSRGAKEVYFNDAANSSLAVLEKNLALVKADRSTYKIGNNDFIQCLKTLKGQYDIIFIDPPYRFDYGVSAMQTIMERDLLSDDGVIVYERDRQFQDDLPSGLTLYDERKYGKTYLSFFKKEMSE